jgi:hypothetical protein
MCNNTSFPDYSGDWSCDWWPAGGTVSRSIKDGDLMDDHSTPHDGTSNPQHWLLIWPFTNSSEPACLNKGSGLWYNITNLIYQEYSIHGTQRGSVARLHFTSPRWHHDHICSSQSHRTRYSRGVSCSEHAMSRVSPALDSHSRKL